MVLNGSPELPGDSNDNLNTNETCVTNYGQNTSDESDSEELNLYEGYEPLPVMDNEDESGENGQANQNVNPDLPNIVSVDIELERNIWSQPRPQELEIVLDNTRTEQIIMAMANITLPSSAIPQWAQEIPEERWKHELLERIRQRRQIQTEGSTSN